MYLFKVTIIIHLKHILRRQTGSNSLGGRFIRDSIAYLPLISDIIGARPIGGRKSDTYIIQISNLAKFGMNATFLVDRTQNGFLCGFGVHLCLKLLEHH